MSGENLHKGHRERLKKQFVESGLDSFQEHQILELLLFYSIPQKDTNELAHLLINTFGSLSGVFEASFEDLISVKGIKANTATLIKLIPQLYEKYLYSKVDKKSVTNTSSGIDIVRKKYYEYMRAKMITKNQEVFMVLSLDNSNRITNSKIISMGALTYANVNPRDIAEFAFRNNATNLIMAHNHPGGMAVPSKQDIDFTKSVVALLRQFQVHIRDHIIFSETDMFSMFENPHLADIFCIDKEKTFGGRKKKTK